jgi:site-specific DNA-methyltransferase (adenine-specific)
MISIIENIDCMIGMARYPDKFFELAIVDPPYKEDVSGLNVGTGNRNFKYNHFNVPGSEYISQLFRVSKNQIIWGFNYYMELLPSTDSIIFWYKHQNGHFSEGEAAWCSLGKTRFFDRPYQADIGDKIHPTQKPVKLYRWLLKNYAKPGDKILDTHLGSGSSRIAAYDMGFDFYGFELDKDYYEAQEKRFNQFKMQTKLF